MWHSTRRGRSLIRKRYNTRKFRLNLVNICIILASLSVILTCGVFVYNYTKQNFKANNNLNIENSPIIESNSKVEIYEEHSNEDEKEFSVAILGELMMGGVIADNLNYNYMSAFKNIAEHTKRADYTILNLATNIIDLEKIKDAKSKYIVTRNIENAFNALGVDGINIANDHILDFGEKIFLDTKDTLKKDYDLIGLKDTITYIEHDGIKVAVIGICNEVIGNQREYTDAGIMMYNLKKVKSMIKEAKQNANTVVLLTHLGLENTHTVTSIMSWFYKELITSGADIVLGSHALGLYPVEIYKGKPIIYSMGYLMSDTNYLLGKETGIFTLELDKSGKLQSLTITPMYINAKKQTLIYSEYNKDMNDKLLKYLTSKLDKESFQINNEKVKIHIN